MSKKEDRDYEKWLEGVKSKLPAEKQALLSQVFDGDGARDVGLDLYRGHLGSSEIDRRMSEIDRTRREFEAEQGRFTQEKLAVQKWFNDEFPKNERLQKQYLALEQQRDALASKLKEYGVDERDLPNAGAVNAGGVTGEDLDRVRRELNSLGALVNTVLPQALERTLNVADKAVREGWKVSGGEIFKQALRQGVTPEQAFDELTRGEREERESKRMKEVIDRAREEGRREILARGSSPDHLSAPGPSALDALRNITATPGDHRSRVDQALAAFDKLGTTDPNPMVPVSG